MQYCVNPAYNIVEVKILPDVVADPNLKPIPVEVVEEVAAVVDAVELVLMLGNVSMLEPSLKPMELDVVPEVWGADVVRLEPNLNPTELADEVDDEADPRPVPSLKPVELVAGDAEKAVEVPKTKNRTDMLTNIPIYLIIINMTSS